MKYLYESHLGDLYTSDTELDYRDLYCEQCGDSDWLIGSFETIQQFWSLIKDDCDINGSGGWSLQYIYPLVVEIFDLNDVIECEDGFCCNSDEEIISRIEELIKESQMNNFQMNNDIVVVGNRVWINGEELPPCPAKGRNITQINDKVYIDGYEYKKGKWRRTLKALWHLWF